MPGRLNLLKSHHNKNENPTRNLYDAIPLVEMKREFLFTFGKEPLNHLP